MIIANPIYDVVFKYLLEDLEIARELFSTILGANITNLTVKPQETLVKSDSGEIKIFHLDFKAVIDLADGQQKTVLLEILKVRQRYELRKLRKYFKENAITEDIYSPKKEALGNDSWAVITICFLGFTLKGVKAPVLRKIGTQCINAVTQQEVLRTNKLIKFLPSDSYTIQIPRLKLKQQNELGQVLEVFSYDNFIDDFRKFDYKQTVKIPLIKKIRHRLAKAVCNEETLRQMAAEDYIERMINRVLSEKGEALKVKALEKKIENIEPKFEKGHEFIDGLKLLLNKKKKELAEV